MMKGIGARRTGPPEAGSGSKGLWSNVGTWIVIGLVTIGLLSCAGMVIFGSPPVTLVCVRSDWGKPVDCVAQPRVLGIIPQAPQSIAAVESAFVDERSDAEGSVYQLVVDDGAPGTLTVTEPGWFSLQNAGVAGVLFLAIVLGIGTMLGDSSRRR